MTTVTGKLTTPGGTLPSNAAVTAVLVDYFNNPVVGFDTTGQAEILSTLLIPVNSDGTWTAQFTPNAQIQLAGGAAQTAWRITEIGAGADGTYWIVVPSGGPFWVGTLRTTLVGGTAPSQVPIQCHDVKKDGEPAASSLCHSPSSAGSGGRASRRNKIWPDLSFNDIAALPPETRPLSNPAVMQRR